MAKHDPPMVLNFDNLDTKRRLMSKVGSLKGLWEVSFKRRFKKRSLNANAYYHSAVARPFLDYLRENFGDDSLTHEQAHIELKKHVLGVNVKTGKDGKEAEFVPTTHNMSVEEFGEYIEQCSAFLASFCGIVVISPEEYFESKQAPWKRAA